MKTQTKKKIKQGATVKALRIEPDLWVHARARVKAEDLDFSKYVRRLIRADLATLNTSNAAA